MSRSNGILRGLASLIVLCLMGSMMTGCALWPRHRVSPPEPTVRTPERVPVPPPVLPPEVPEPAPEAAEPSPAPPKATEPVSLSFERVLALQVGLDRLDFSPNCLDGRLGNQTRMALEAWQISAGEPVTGVPTDLIFDQLIPAQPLGRYFRPSAL